MRTPAARSFSHGRRLRHERDEIVEVGALDAHRDAVGERDQAQPAVRVLGGARREELLERALRRAARRSASATNDARSSKRIWRPAIVAQNALLVLVEVLRIDALPLALDHRRCGGGRRA